METVTQMGIALLRKALFAAELLTIYIIVDRWIFQVFNTPERIKDAPIAIALLLGLLAIAVALS